MWNTVGSAADMGKQINYWLEIDGFKPLAQKALELGCEIVREDLSKYDRTRVTVSRDLDIITDENGAWYFFHLPEAGKIEIKEFDCGERLNHNFNECMNSIIEAGYSRVITEEKHIRRARLYLSTGYYDKNEVFIYRPDCIVKVYNSLARYVKKLAPYTEITRSYIDRNGAKAEYKIKEYISPYCLGLFENEGYDLGM